MGWRVADRAQQERRFSIHPGADPASVMPKRTKNGGERQADTGERASSVIVPGSPEDPCRHHHFALARILETAQSFPDAYRAIQQVLANLAERRT